MSLYTWLNAQMGCLYYSSTTTSSSSQYTDLPMNESKIKAYVSELLDEKHMEYIDEIVQEVLDKMNEDEEEPNNEEGE